MPRKPKNRDRETQAAQLRATGMDYTAIADQLGYADASGAWKAVQRALTRQYAEPVDEARRLIVGDLFALKRKAWDILERHHITISQGRVVTLNGEPVPDDGPALQAIAQALACDKEIAKVLGLYAPARSEQHITIDSIDAEIRALEAELAKHDRESA